MSLVADDAVADASLKELPAWVWSVRYDGSCHPHAKGVVGSRPLKRANCQLFAYAVLGLVGRPVPPFWSTELWEDDAATERVSTPARWDLVLFNGSARAWGAHVGVIVDSKTVLHLCKSIGIPALWTFEDFSKWDRYRCLIGFKRVRTNAQF